MNSPPTSQLCCTGPHLFFLPLPLSTGKCELVVQSWEERTPGCREWKAQERPSVPFRPRAPGKDELGRKE